MAKKEKQEKQITLDDIVNTVSVMGLPKNEKSKSILRSRLSSLVKGDEESFVDKMIALPDKCLAERIILYLQDSDVINNYGLGLMENSPNRAYCFGRYVKNEEILNKLSDAFSKNDPETAYYVGQRGKDSTLLEQSFTVLVEKDPILAFDLEYDHWCSSKNKDEKHFAIVGEKLIGVDHLKAYRAAVYSEDADLLVKARKSFAEHDAHTAYDYGLNEAGDDELMRLSAYELVDGSPDICYDLGKILKDTKLVNKARKILCDIYPSKGFELGKQYKDKKLLNKSGWRLIDEEPKSAYEAGIITKDKKLISKARYSLVQKDAKGAYELITYSKKQDKELLRLAGWKLLKNDPVFAYYAAFGSGCKMLINKAKDMLMEYKLSEAKFAARHTKDKEFLKMIKERGVHPSLQEFYESEN